MKPRLSTVAFPMLASLLASLLVMGLEGCGKEEQVPDAYGNFEATEVRVAAEVGGRLLEFPVEEGQQLDAGVPVALVETTGLALERAQVVADRQATLSRIASVEAQTAVLAEQQRLARSELERTQRLAADSAATAQQLDQAASQVKVLDRRVGEAGSQRATIRDQVAALDARLAQIDDQINRGAVVNPTAGTVLTVYAEAGELVAPGQPLYDVADLSSLELRAYVSGAQLAGLALDQQVQVAVDRDAENRLRLPGTLTWIASKAEFTPSTMQTREERVDLAYAVKVRVANPDGRLKIGMPGEVYWTTPTAPPSPREP